MKQLLILITRSYKYGGYCVAGLDVKTKQWIRLVSSGDPAGNEIPKSIFEPFNDLDILEVETSKRAPSGCQTENYVLDPAVPPVRRGRLVRYELLSPSYLFHSPNLFGNTRSYLSETEIAGQKLSIGLFKVEALCFNYALGDDGKMHYRADFTYRSARYSGLSVTDPVYRKDEFAGQTVGHALLAVSLPAIPYSNGRYYKFIAKIFPVSEEEARRIETAPPSVSAPRVPVFSRDHPEESEKDLARAVRFLESLSDGKDPDTGAALDPGLMLSPSYAAWFRYSAAALSGRREERKERPRYSHPRISESKISGIEVSDRAVSASALKNRLNAVCEPDGGKISARAITEFFGEAGMIDASQKTPTDLGEEYGISTELYRPAAGIQVRVLIYGGAAQRFLIDNLERLADIVAPSAEKSPAEEPPVAVPDVSQEEKAGSGWVKNAGLPWSAEEDLRLKEESEKGMSFLEIAKSHGRPSIQIRGRLIQLGYTRGTLETDRRWTRWESEEDLALAKEFLSGTPVAELERLHGRNRAGIMQRLKKLGLIAKDGPSGKDPSSDFPKGRVE